MQSVDAKVDAGAFTYFDNLLLDLFASFGNHFFDACRVDASVGDEFVQGESCDFSAYGVEAAEDDGVGRVVDDDLYASKGFQGADVATFTADDAALHLFVFKVKHADSVFDGVFGGSALD